MCRARVCAAPPACHQPFCCLSDLQSDVDQAHVRAHAAVNLVHPLSQWREILLNLSVVLLLLPTGPCSVKPPTIRRVTHFRSQSAHHPIKCLGLWCHLPERLESKMAGHSFQRSCSSVFIGLRSVNSRVPPHRASVTVLGNIACSQSERAEGIDCFLFISKKSTLVRFDR